MTDQTFLLAKVVEGEEGWEEKQARVERKLSEAVRRTGRGIPWQEGGVAARVGESPVTHYYSTTSKEIRDHFVEQGPEPETE